MSSDEVAAYLSEVGCSERKLEYCRQILGESMGFAPQTAFNLNCCSARNTLSKNQFFELVRFTGLTAQQQIELVFNYFQLHPKHYITLQQFSDAILPQQPQESSQTTQKYPLKYCLQKLFGQIVENEKMLSLRRTFADGLKGCSRPRRVELNDLKAFLASHGKYPTSAILHLIFKQLSLNRPNHLHTTIAAYLLSFNQNTSLSPSTILQNTPSTILQNTPSAILQNTQPNAQKDSTKQPPLSHKKETNICLTAVRDDLVTKANGQPKIANNASCNYIEERIKSIMGSINLKQRPDLNTIDTLSACNNSLSHISIKTVSDTQDLSFSKLDIASNAPSSNEYGLTQRSQASTDTIEGSISHRFTKCTNSSICSQKDDWIKDTWREANVHKSIVWTGEDKQNTHGEHQRQKARKKEYWRNLVKERPPSACSAMLKNVRA